MDFDFDVNKFADQLKPAAEKLASTLGTASDHLLGAGIRYEIALGIFGVITGAFGLAVAVTGLVMLIRHGRARGRGETKCDCYTGCWNCAGAYIMYSAMLAAGGLMFFPSMYAAIPRLAAPEWMLGKELISLIK